MYIQSATKEFIQELIANNKREFGRTLNEYRNIEIKKGVIEHAEGSAQVTFGNTKVLAGVKITVGEPMHDKPNEGNLITGAELLPMASAEYEMGPPSPEAIEVARVIDRGIRAAGIIDTAALFIEEGKVWDIFVDIYVLNYDGNLFDAGTMAATVALLSARMPKLEGDKVISEGVTDKLKTNGIITSCTFAKASGKIFIDPDGNEEKFMDSRITIANDGKEIRAMQKGLAGGFTLPELNEAVEISFEKHNELKSLMERALGE
jgi:exosome complex component RRP42